MEPLLSIGENARIALVTYDQIDSGRPRP